MADYISRDEVLEYSEYTGNFNLVVPVRFIRAMKAADVQPIIETKNMAIVSDEFICKKCGIYLKDYIKVVMDEDNEGYIDEQHYDYEPKYCPECGAKVESSIKTPKRDKPLYTMDEICKMNSVEFN